MKRAILIISLFLSGVANSICAQKLLTRDIKSFGAVGNGKTNDQHAFELAANFFNHRGGNGKLIISAGTYIVGKQSFTGNQTNKPSYEGGDVLHFSKVKHFSIEGTSQTILRYPAGFHFGSFTPSTGEPYLHGNNLFVNYAYAASIGVCIYIDSCTDVTVNKLTLDGNNQKVILGGVFGDVGYQLWHYGIYIHNSVNIHINNMKVHHFACDGICLSNVKSEIKDQIVLSNSSFEYNSRQGLSWVGGNDLKVTQCKFNHTGRGFFYSPPGSGVDIEAEIGPVRNGVFDNCEFIDNIGAGMVADMGDSEGCTFNNCTLWGVTNWSAWVNKPSFTFNSCNFYGSFVHGYVSPDVEHATKFFKCYFEDKPYQGKEPYGVYLVESNDKSRMSFTDCRFIANKKKLFWISIPYSTKPEEKYQFTNCYFEVKNAGYPQGDFIAVVRGIVMKNCTFQFSSPLAKKKGYYLTGYTEYNIDRGGNKVIYAEDKQSTPGAK